MIAFDSSNGCPDGWGVFDSAAGRVIIGEGKGNGLSERSYRDAGGAETHVLTLQEMPNHTHSTVQMISDNNTDGVDSTTIRSGDHHNQTRQTGANGGNKPHNNMPPFIVLTVCKKV